MEHKWKIMDSKYLQYPVRIALLLLKLISFKSWEGNWKYNVHTMNSKYKELNVQTLVDLTWPSTFCVAKRKNEKKVKKEEV